MSRQKLQSRRGSLTESLTNIAIGSGINIVITQSVSIANTTFLHNAMPWFNWHVSIGSNVIMTAVFTIVSIARSYFIRRAFNKYQEAQTNG